MESYLMYCVVDTSLIIDLYVGNIIVEFFRLSYDFVAPDFIINELQEPDSKILLECGLRQHTLTGDQVLEVVDLRAKYRNPSVNDLSALLLAKIFGCMLLTNDRSLRNAAQQERVQIHGTLWVLDEMVRLQVIPTLRAVDALRLMRVKGSRFPEDECEKRFQAWLNE